MSRYLSIWLVLLLMWPGVALADDDVADDVYYWCEHPSMHRSPYGYTQPEDEEYIEMEEWQQDGHLVKVVMRIHQHHPTALPGPTPSYYSTIDAARLPHVQLVFGDSLCEHPMRVRAKIRRY